MWHYAEGIHNWDPIWTAHGIRIMPGPSSLWLDATGRRLPVPLFPGFDTLGTLEHIGRSGHDHTWFVLTQDHREEFALSGSEQNPDLTGKSVLKRAAGADGTGAPAPVEAFKRHGVDFVVERDLAAWCGDERASPGSRCSTPRRSSGRSSARDRELANPFSKDSQVTAIRGARRYLARSARRVARRTGSSIPRPDL